MKKHPELSDLATTSDLFTVSPVMLKRSSSSRWISASWTLLGVLPGLAQAEIAAAEKQGELLMLPTMTLHLYPQHCDAYYHNLMSATPKIYLITQPTDDGIEALLLTVDYDEAASYMETDETVYDAPLSDGLCVWLERYMVMHYQPQLPKKRKRRHWHDDQKENAR